jgi:membrane protease subunit HflK
MIHHTIKSTLTQSIKKTISIYKWVVFLSLAIYLMSGIYSVKSSELAILQRFGKQIDDKIQPGIHYALPWPIDIVTRIPIRNIKRLVIDDFSESKNSYTITGDNHLITLECVIQYTIAELSAFVFYSDSPEKILKELAVQALIHSLSRMTIDEALTHGKTKIAAFVRQHLQQNLSITKTGLFISSVELSSIKPPPYVKRFFSDVVESRMDEQKLVHEAESYQNQTIPAAHAKAAQLIENAKAYQQTALLNAQAETRRFEKLLESGVKHHKTVRMTLYQETMAQILKQIKKLHLVQIKTDQKPAAKIRLHEGSEIESRLQ